MRPWLLLLALVGLLLAATAGCTCGSNRGEGGHLPIAKAGPASWIIDGQPFAVSSTYYLALAEGLQFTVEFEVPPATNPESLSDAEAYELAFPLMRYVAENRLHERQQITDFGSGRLAVSRIGVVLFAQTPSGVQGYRVARDLAEILARSGVDPSVATPNLRNRSASQVAAFTLKGAGAGRLLFLLTMVLASGMTLGALAKWIRRRRDLPRRWLWLAAIVLGIGKIGLNWTTGQTVVVPLAFQLLSVGAIREAGSSSWMLYLSIPLGALVFLFRSVPSRGAPETYSEEGAA